MDELLRWSFGVGGDELAMTSTFHAVFAMLMSCALSLLVGYVYRITHSGVSYSKSVVRTFVILSVIVSVIMIIIGSNVARAFSLVGALSIIRFRTAVKEPIDVAYIFLTMAIGMACGTGFFPIAVVFTLVSVAILYFMHRFDVGGQPASEMLLRLNLPDGVDPKAAMEEVFYRLLERHTLIGAESGDGGTVALTFSIALKRGTEAQELVLAVRQAAAGGRVQLITGLGETSV